MHSQEVANQNKRKIMESNLFSDGNQPTATSFNEQSPNSKNNRSQIQEQRQITHIKPQPEQQFESPPAIHKISFDFNVKKPKSFHLEHNEESHQNQIRKLNFSVSNQMKSLRDNISKDFNDFSQRMQNLNKEDEIKMEVISVDDFPILKFPDNIRNEINLNNTNKEINEEPSKEEPDIVTESQFIFPDETNFED